MILLQVLPETVPNKDEMAGAAASIFLATWPGWLALIAFGLAFAAAKHFTRKHEQRKRR